MLDIKNYEGQYAVTPHGKVWSYQSKKFLSSKSKNSKGYPKVMLFKRGKNRKYYSIHRLVASTYIPNEYKKPQINHKNGIKTDNRVENLEWCTNRENTIHALNGFV